MNTCGNCSVREAAICRSLSPCELEELKSLGCERVIEQGHTVMWEGDESVMVGNIIEGVFKLTASTADGEEQTLGIMFPSDFIGRPFGATSSHSVTALTDARICTFPRAAFDHFARDHADLEHSLLSRSLTELDRARQWMVILARKSARARVATFLLEMAERLAPDAGGAYGDKPARFELPFGRQDMADMLGLTIETVSRQLTRLRSEGVIETPNRRSLAVLDRRALEAFAKAG